MEQTDSTVIAATQEEVKKGKTDILFPEYAVKDDTHVDNPATVTGKKEEMVTPEPEVKTEPEYLSVEDFGDRMVKIKVDGVEQTIPFKDAIRRIQTDKHLTEKGQKLSEERRALEDLKKSILSENKPVVMSNEPEPDDEIYKEYVKPHMNKYENEIKSLKQTVKDMESTLQPIQYQNNLKQIASLLKDEGHDDFLDYVPKIESHIFSLPVEKQAEFDNTYGFTTIYKNLKIKELREAASKASNTPIKADDRIKPKLVSIEGGSNVPSGADDYSSKYQTALKRAQESGDFTELLRVKGVI